MYMSKAEWDLQPVRGNRESAESTLRAATILVVEDSTVMRKVLCQILSPNFGKILSAACYRDAVRELEENPEIDFVLSDVVLPDGNGFDLLEDLTRRALPKPKVILITARWEPSEKARAVSLGAIDYLPKPVSFRDIRASLSALQPLPPRAPRSRLNSRVWIVSPDQNRDRLVSFDLRDISKSGALIATEGPLGIGSQLELELSFEGGEVMRARGTVVRVQEPSWPDIGGTAIRFDWVESPSLLERVILIAGENAEHQ